MGRDWMNARHSSGPAKLRHMAGRERSLWLRRVVLVTIVVVLLAAGHDVSAQQAPVGAGGQIQQIPPVPVPERPRPTLPVPQRSAPVASQPDDAKFPVVSLHVSGETLFPENELIAAAAFKPDREMTLPALQAMAARITEFYNQRGYFVAQAYLPPQDITNGIVTIAVVEGRFGEISLLNQTVVSDVVLTRILNGLDSGDPVNAAPLERRLLIISDMPGVAVSSTMAPGAAVGTSNLVVKVSPGPRVSGSVEADNWGNPYSGAYRLGGTVNYNEPFGIGDVLSLRVLQSTTGGLTYGRASYQAQVYDATVGVALTAFRYSLGKQFSDLDAHGTEGIASVYASYPLIRSYNNNLNVLVDFDQRWFQDDIDATSTHVGRSASVLIVELYGDHRDTFGGGGFSTYALAGTFGNLNIQTNSARALDALGARTSGGYAKVSASASRLQQVMGPISLYGAVRGQASSKNLDISEKMELGGANGVRAYPEGEAYGDQGYIATLEARWLLPQWSGPVPGRLQLFTFVDNGYVTVNRDPFGGGKNGLSRSGIGLGAIWFDTNNFAVTATYAHMIGPAATSYSDLSGQFWVQLVKYF